MLTLTVDTLFRSALSPLSVSMVFFTVTGVISPIIVNVYTNGSVNTHGCYISLMQILLTFEILISNLPSYVLRLITKSQERKLNI